jgi:glutathione-regulated potassium-efflux system protein KefB
MGEKVLVDLGIHPDTARDHAKQFHDHDVRLLRAQYEVHDDEDALLQTVQDARRELEELFAADVGEGVLGEIAASGDKEAP